MSEMIADLFEGQPLRNQSSRTAVPGAVRSFGWGIYVPDGSGSTSTALLPVINPTIDWVRLPQRFAVRIQVLGETPVPLRIGQTVSVAMTQSLSTVGSNVIATSK
jgi:multidrug resistance efflux pump